MERSSGEHLKALGRLDEITRRLRRECPWDREQDECSIVPHTVEEAYELADAAHTGDDAKLLDELGDVLFQVCFLALLLEERGAGDLGAVADGCREKLIRRHPHVFGDVVAPDSATVRRNWDSIKRGETPSAETPGKGGGSELRDGVQEKLPSTLYARRVLSRAGGGAGGDVVRGGANRPGPGGDSLASTRAAAGALASAEGRERRFEAAGELLLAAVAAASEAGANPELALRAATERLAVGAREAERAAG